MSNNHNLFSSRLGKFTLNKRYIVEKPGKAFEILSTVIPVRAEYKFEDDCIHYVALSHSFECLPKGVLVPKYEVIFEQEKFIGWKKVDN